MTKTETYQQLSKSKTAILLSNLEQQAATLETQSFQSVEQMGEALKPFCVAISQLVAVQTTTARKLEIEMSNGSQKINEMHSLAATFNERQQTSQLNQNIIWATATLITSLLVALSVTLLMPPAQVSLNTKALAQQINQHQTQMQQPSKGK